MINVSICNVLLKFACRQCIEACTFNCDVDKFITLGDIDKRRHAERGSTNSRDVGVGG